MSRVSRVVVVVFYWERTSPFGEKLEYWNAPHLRKLDGRLRNNLRSRKLFHTMCVKRIVVERGMRYLARKNKIAQFRNAEWNYGCGDSEQWWARLQLKHTQISNREVPSSASLLHNRLWRLMDVWTVQLVECDKALSLWGTLSFNGEACFWTGVQRKQSQEMLSMMPPSKVVGFHALYWHHNYLGANLNNKLTKVV